jgi:hypothetical protein
MLATTLFNKLGEIHMRYFQLMALTVSMVALMSTAQAGSAAGISSNNSVGAKVSAAGVKADTKSNAGLGLKTTDDYSSQEGEDDTGTYDSSAAASSDTGYSSNASVDNSAAATVAGSANNTVNGTVKGAGHVATDLNDDINTSSGAHINNAAGIHSNSRVGVGAHATGSLLGR